MAAEDKIKIFDSIDSLIKEIKNDSATNKIVSNRYPVRFIMFENFNEFQNLLMKLIELNIKIFGLETLLPENNKDVWISNDDLSDAIRNIQVSSIIAPFSEIVRFYDKDNFNAIFFGVSKIGNSSQNGNFRLYIPLIGLQRRFCDFLDSISRTTEIPPVWSVKTTETHSVNVFLTQKQIQNSAKEYLGIETVYDWLQFWKTNPTPKKVVCSSSPINGNADNSRPDNIFTPIKINSAFDFIEKFHELSLNIPYNSAEEKFWQELLPNIKDNSFSLQTFVNKQFNVYELTTKDLLNKWTANETSEFQRWLLKHYYLQNISDNQYFTDIISDCTNYSSAYLLHEITFVIFENPNEKSYYEQRNNLLQMIDEQYNLSDSDLSILENKVKEKEEENTEATIKLCSGRFSFEKELFIGWYKVGKLKTSDLEKLYPDFTTYLSDYKHNNWATNYIKQYKIAKIKDQYTDDIKNLISEKNANETSFWKWYHEFELSKELLAKEKVDTIYWLDGVGIEWLSLIAMQIQNSKFQIIKCVIARTDIPSSTEYNSFENIAKLDDLDKFIHSEQYKYPISICKEIDIVKNMLTKNLNQSAETTIAIVSDHGLTALSRLVDSKKYAAKASHEGRYIKLDSAETVEDTDYIRHKNGEDNFKVALTHASLNTKPVREVHGGCTPEEILVPFLVISNKKSARAFEKNVEMKQQTDSVLSDTQKKIGFEEEELF